MKNFVCLLIAFCFTTFCSIPLFAQTFDEDPEEEEVNGNEIVLDNQSISSDIFLNLGFDTAPNVRNQQITGNSVFLTQIGDLNIVSVNSNTNSSEIQVTQRGNSNFTALDYRANTIVTNVTQDGNFNLIRDFVNNPTEDASLDLLQQGDNLTFERFGTNSITRSLRFVQTEASPTIIIRSFQ
ncbi:hypothetical protein [uncultured Dokdonia sp.]|uniref:hypothetical protein n=1 Tax=uncultured Dokdonia sp. TaxID=575653 RepID=UPI00260F95D1|nr:hypothetical protein [uncultured Dokdonia sp.]